MRTKIIFSLLLLCSIMLSCRSGPQKQKTAPIDTASITDAPAAQRLITDYSGMKEDFLVASAWIDANFTLEECADISVQPVLNFSQSDYAYAQERIAQTLDDAAAAKKKNPAGKSVLITAAITALHGKPGFLKRFSPTYEDMPTIELEIVIVDVQSKRELVKVCHMARAKDTDQAIDLLLDDVTAFLNTRI